jgi:hypothetical protein
MTTCSHSQQPDDIYLHEAFRKGLQTKVQMAIISMLQRKLEEVIEFVITMEGELPVWWKNITKYHRANPDNEGSNDLNKENHCKTKKNGY